jgi:uncharacterized glyoxalase superfamily metalloenzyme YdcJ
MSIAPFIAADEIRSQFSQALSVLYRQEVPAYGALVDLVARLNAQALQRQPDLRAGLEAAGELAGLGSARHGAIRLGTAAELSAMRRVFAVMGMFAVDYYDLSAAGVPVHATAFRPVDPAALDRNPLRMFCSLLRLDLIADTALREEAAILLSRRRIFSDQALTLTAQAEQAGGLTDTEAAAFVAAVLPTFRWQGRAVVNQAAYQRLLGAHRLLADIVCFPGPHINHLTLRTLDIDAVQSAMPAHGLAAKELVEGPPRRVCALLLRQTSFKAVPEPVRFVDDDGQPPVSHSARFGEVEQRGAALTPRGRRFYDRLLAQAQLATRDAQRAGGARAGQVLAQVFSAFPDDLTSLREQGLAYFRYRLSTVGEQAPPARWQGLGLSQAMAQGLVQADPQRYEDFLPVSAAGIFQSNLAGRQDSGPTTLSGQPARQAFEQALGCAVLDGFTLYAQAELASLQALPKGLQLD